MLHMETTMNSNRSPAEWTFRTATPSRPNLMAAAVIEAGIILQLSIGTRNAAKFLESFDIPLAVSLRVLTTQQRRRKSKDRRT
jgi:hypothetical protein